MLVAPTMSLNVLPSLVETCHCTEVAGLLVATLKVTGDPAQMDCVSGLVVMTGDWVTVSVAAADGVAAHVLVNTARY